MIPLSMALQNEESIILKIGGKDEIKKHIETLGFVVGGKVKVITVVDGNIIVDVKGSRIAIGKDIANKIMV